MAGLEADAVKESEDSHMIKHWVEHHPEEKNVPKFTFKVVASFRDALTRQVSEAVRIDCRGGGILNSRSEYSRCQIPRLTINMEDWKERKHAEQKGIEQAAASMETNEVDIMEGGAAASMMVEKRKKCQ